MSPGSSIGWKLRRLRAMGRRELLWRLGQAARARLEQSGIGLARPLPASGTCGTPWVRELPRGFVHDRYVSAADRILAGCWTVFALKDAPLGFPPQWNVDPKTGIRAPARFGKAIDYRDDRQVGDIKYLWELNRHLQLVTLAQAWHLSGNPAYAVACRALLSSWFVQCPYASGPNWTSSLEAAYRLVNWAVAWHLLGGESSQLFDRAAGEQFREQWLRSIREHSHFIAGWLSRYSSANNHLLGEYMGLLVGAITWPLWPESTRWRRLARDGFEQEALLQNAKDGVNLEQAIYYQHEVMDMMLTCAHFGRQSGIEFSRAFWERLEQMFGFIAALMDRSGNLPMIGDADDALIVRWSQEDTWNPYRSLLATGAILFGRGDWKTRAGRCDDKTRWLLGDRAGGLFAALTDNEPPAPVGRFPAGGYYVLAASRGRPNEVLAVVDCGPLGYGSIAAHGHADALSLHLSLGGLPFLIDPGTYAYHTGEKWRRYFRSTRAHNTICIDGLDQSTSGGNFLWLQKANARCTGYAPESAVQLFEGTHDGYERLGDPVTHRRQVALDPERNRCVVRDDLVCCGQHVAEVCWHFSELCDVHAEGDTVVASAGGSRLELRVTTPAEATLSLLRGQDHPPAGWISRRYDEKVPSTTAIWRVIVTGTTRVETTMEFSLPEPPNRR